MQVMQTYAQFCNARYGLYQTPDKLAPFELPGQYDAHVWKWKLWVKWNSGKFAGLNGR